MKHYVAYHNTEKMSNLRSKPDDGNPIELSVLTSKKFDRIEGSIIWLISGDGTPRRYFLEFWFLADRVGPSPNPAFVSKIFGTSGVDMKSIPLTDLPWFKGFQNYLGNFGTGLNPITDDHVSALCALVASEKFAAPSDRSDSANHTEGDSGPVARRKYVRNQAMRDPAVVTEVKRLHDFTCQVCGLRLETADGPYAQCAHIRPIGSPHDGPDGISNVLCLCPNDHILFDTGSFSIRDDMTLIGLKGALRVVPEHRIDLACLAHHRMMSKLRES